MNFPIRIAIDKLDRRMMDGDEFGAYTPPKKKPAKKKTTTQAKRPISNRGTGSTIGTGTSFNDTPPTFVRPAPAAAPTNWYRAGLDFLLTSQQIQAEVEKVKATAGQHGQQLTDADAEEAVARKFNVQPQPGGGSVGSGIGSGIDGVWNWAMANPIIPIGAGIMLFLLFKQPPGRK